MRCHSSESPLYPSHLFLRACPWREGARDTHGTDGMQSGPMACLARQVPCSQPGLLGCCQRAESEALPLGWAADSTCGGGCWELGPWAGSCRNSGSTRSSLRRRPLWSWAPQLCTRFSSSTRPSMSQVCRFPVTLLGTWASEFRDDGGRLVALSWILGGPPWLWQGGMSPASGIFTPGRVSKTNLWEATELTSFSRSSGCFSPG